MEGGGVHCSDWSRDWCKPTIANNSTAQLDYTWRWGMANICGEVVITFNLKVGWNCWGIAENYVNEVIFHSLGIVVEAKQIKYVKAKQQKNFIYPSFQKLHFFKNFSIKTSVGYHWWPVCDHIMFDYRWSLRLIVGCLCGWLCLQDLLLCGSHAGVCGARGGGSQCVNSWELPTKSPSILHVDFPAPRFLHLPWHWTIRGLKHWTYFSCFYDNTGT